MTWARRSAALAVAALAFCPAAAGRDVSVAQLLSLAERASSDPSALAGLREVDSVDGVPVDLRRALAGASPQQLQRRLRTLAAARSGRPIDTAAARRAAQEITAEHRFRPRGEESRPLRRPLQWLADRFRSLGEEIDRLTRRISVHLPGGDWTFWGIAAAIVVAAAAFAAVLLARGRSPAAGARGPRRAREEGPLDPRRLEREADAAERAGELEQAIRLRFRAGLLRLDRAEVIRYRVSLTTGEVARRLRSRDFDRLAASFDEIVYGGRPPREDDVRTAREGWQTVLGAVAP